MVIRYALQPILMLLCVFFVKSEPKQTKGHLYQNQTGLIDFLSFYHIQNSITGEEESLVTKDIYTIHPFLFIILPWYFKFFHTPEKLIRKR